MYSTLHIHKANRQAPVFLSSVKWPYLCGAAVQRYFLVASWCDKARGARALLLATVGALLPRLAVFDYDTRYFAEYLTGGFIIKDIAYFPFRAFADFTEALAISPICVWIPYDVHGSFSCFLLRQQRRETSRASASPNSRLGSKLQYSVNKYVLERDI